MFQRTVFIGFIIICTSACTGWDHENVFFDEEVSNLQQLNSEYDDYNSTDGSFGFTQEFYFSSNRYSNGENFDIVGVEGDFIWDQQEGILSGGFDVSGYEEFMGMINTECNELGPYELRLYDQENSLSNSHYKHLVMYATDCSGNYDIHMGLYLSIDDYLFGNDSTSILSFTEISFLNTNANELYPAFFGQNFHKYHYFEWMEKGNDIEKIMYCSDAEGTFDLYEMSIPNNEDLLTVLQSDSSFTSSIMDISSPADDKCPFINGRLMVFTSNREGGYGGFDLYYSVYENGRWSSPTNFGSRINSEYDEYRPITFFQNSFDNVLMIFSSNRPGGKGGFDLYQVGIDQKENVKDDAG